MPLRMLILVLSLLLLVGCSTTLYVIDKQDFYQIPKGTKIGNEVIDRDGYFLSNLYMKKVAEVKIKRR